MPADHVEAWDLNAAADKDYLLQMSSEHRIWDAAKTRWVWKARSTPAYNHYWDCEVYQCAVADWLQVEQLPTLAEIIRQRQLQRRQQKDAQESGLKTPDGRPFLITDR